MVESGRLLDILSPSRPTASGGRLTLVVHQAHPAQFAFETEQRQADGSKVAL